MPPQAPTTPTKLGQAKAGKATPEPSKFAQATAGVRVKEPFTIPRLGIPAIMTLPGSNRLTEIEGAVWERMRALKLELNVTTEGTFELERARRTLAEAVLDPDAVARGEWNVPIGTAAEWGELDPDLVSEVWRFYGDIRVIYDPTAQGLSKEDYEEISAAVKKKDLRLLRYFGVRRLATWLVTTDDLQPSSRSPSSGPSESSAET